MIHQNGQSLPQHDPVMGTVMNAAQKEKQQTVVDYSTLVVVVVYEEY
jgi:hypothetical protein